MKEINAAYECLKRPVDRSKYDYEVLGAAGSTVRVRAHRAKLTHRQEQAIQAIDRARSRETRGVPLSAGPLRTIATVKRRDTTKTWKVLERTVQSRRKDRRLGPIIAESSLL